MFSYLTPQAGDFISVFQRVKFPLTWLVKCFFILLKLPYFFFFEDETAMNIMINTTTTPPTAAQVITIPFNLKIRFIKT
ncbi:hypothetical protein PHACT_10165 [Pseudohongiella acticola]|jgi:hypothetical protein|uniref:Uncharacterized protein n=1 Tax=Pseudohongiella acticola TaxID=1524254 RepID=A0A1E8CMC5_9GAMM|nr:hypothetical protein PHACT_10165 [Pseudohongiella acticola]|tara:strand:- start:301 stop:537 length:237 start_codon:yes stop_codon:yes gene_type:complete